MRVGDGVGEPSREIEVDGGAVGIGVINGEGFGLFACVVGE